MGDGASMDDGAHSDSESYTSASSYSSYGSRITALPPSEANSRITNWEWTLDSFQFPDHHEDKEAVLVECRQLQTELKIREQSWYVSFGPQRKLLYKVLEECEINYYQRISAIFDVRINRAMARQKTRSRMRSRHTYAHRLGAPNIPWLTDRSLLPLKSQRASRKVPRRRSDKKTGVSYCLSDFRKYWRASKGETLKKAWKKLDRKRLAPDSRIFRSMLMSWEQCCSTLSFRWLSCDIEF